MTREKLKLDSLKLGTAAGIVGAIVTFITTIFGIYGRSGAADFMANTIWNSYGYTVTWAGAFLGLVIGFVYAFVLIWLTAKIYNKLI